MSRLERYYDDIERYDGPDVCGRRATRETAERAPAANAGHRIVRCRSAQREDSYRNEIEAKRRRCRVDCRQPTYGTRDSRATRIEELLRCRMHIDRNASSPIAFDSSSLLGKVRVYRENSSERSIKKSLQQKDMFTKTDLDSVDIEQASEGRYRGLYTTHYDQFAFKCWESEESIRITRAPKEYNEDNGVQFWVAAVLQDNWSDRMKYLRPYIESALFEKISESDFNSEVQYHCNELMLKPSLPLIRGGFIGALTMHKLDAELIVDLFAEYEKEYVHFAWESTA